MHLCWYRLLVQFDIFISVYKLGLVLEGWNPHISVGAEICKLGLVFRVGTLLELFLFSVDADKTLRL
jgi:hypothetical protein